MRVAARPSLRSTLFLALSFALAALGGALLLWLPWMHHGELSFLDALFTATSAVCVTGLTVVNTATAFTLAGKVVILVLIQFLVLIVVLVPVLVQFLVLSAVLALVLVLVLVVVLVLVFVLVVVLVLVLVKTERADDCCWMGVMRQGDRTGP